jgi:hypothetical protein
MQSLAARASTEWKDFTPQHASVRKRARAIALGNEGNHVAAVVGVYGSGKSTLLFDVMRACEQQGILTVWDEAAAFFRRLLGDSEAIRGDDFVRRTLAWAQSLRDGGGLQSLRDDLLKRGRSDVVDHISEAPPQSNSRLVLLLDEMEQAHELLRERIQTDDGNPLRSLFDSSGEDLAIIVAYAPESYHSLGDADRGRHVTLRVPPLTAEAIARGLQIPRGYANFAWWASRGRARGVVQAVDRIVIPVMAGELDQNPQLLSTVLDDLPRVFGVPAVIQDHLSTEELLRLPKLDPESRTDFYGIRLNADNPIEWMGAVEEKVVGQFGDDIRRPLMAVLHEVAAIAGGCAGADGYTALEMREVGPLIELALARAQEAGTVQGFEQKHRETVEYAINLLSPALMHTKLWISLDRLANEVFPSPFTDPLLPIDGHHPSADEVLKEFKELANRDGFLVHWTAHDAWSFVTFDALESWLTDFPPEELVRGFCRVLILESGAPRPLTRLAVEAGLIRHEPVPAFSAAFLRSAAVVLSRAPGARPAADLDLDDLVGSVGDSRDLKRKVAWHQERLAALLHTMRPQRSVSLEDARQEAEHLRKFLSTKRLGQDSPGLLALCGLLQTPVAESQAVLSELADVFGSDRDLRKLVARSKRLEGAAVVVDDLLPTRSRSTRWTQANLPKLRAFVQRHNDPSCAPLLSWLLGPESPAAIRVILDQQVPEDSSPELVSGLQSLSRLSTFTRRLGEVHEGIGAILEETPSRLAETMDLGTALNIAVRATPDTKQLERLMKRLDKLPEPWVPTLARWVVAQFIDAALSTVGNEEAKLREWESAATKAKVVGVRADGVASRLRELGWTGLVGRIHTARGHIRVKLDDPQALLSAIDTLGKQIDGFEQLLSELQQLVQIAQDKRLDCQQLVSQFDTKGTDILEDVELVREVLDLLADAEGRLPRPRGGLRPWLVTLRDHLAKSREERLRSRVRNLLGPKIAGCLSRLFENNVDNIEDNWSDLEDGFREGVGVRLHAELPSASDRVAEVVHSALVRQQLLKQMDQPAPVAAIDANLRATAESGDLDYEGIERELRQREAVRSALGRMEEEVAPHSILTTIVSNKLDYSSASEALESFDGKLENLWEVIKALDATKTVSDVDEVEDPDRFLAEVARIAQNLRDKKDELVNALKQVNDLCARLGGIPVRVGTDPTIEEVSEAVDAARANAGEAIGKRYAKLQERAAAIKVALPGLRPAKSPEQSAAKLDHMEQDIALLEPMAHELDRMGVSWADENVEPLPLGRAQSAMNTRLKHCRREIVTSRKEVETLMLRMRLFRIPTASLESDVGSGRVDVLRDAQARAEASLSSAVSSKERRLSNEALTYWREINQRGFESHPLIGELLQVGLLIPATPETLK